MPVRVVDASALGALVFGEPKAEEIARALGGASMVAPALLWFEMASLCLKKVLAYPARTEQLLKAFALSHQLSIEILEVDQVAVVELARTTGLTTYDASYLWLARHVQGELVTLDRKIRKSAAKVVERRR
jgi:predicted nucleic acid-binding protein